MIDLTLSSMFTAASWSLGVLPFSSPYLVLAPGTFIFRVRGFTTHLFFSHNAAVVPAYPNLLRKLFFLKPFKCEDHVIDPCLSASASLFVFFSCVWHSSARLEVACFFCTVYRNISTDTTGRCMFVMFCAIHACNGNVFRHGICVCRVGVCVFVPVNLPEMRCYGDGTSCAGSRLQYSP